MKLVNIRNDDEEIAKKPNVRQIEIERKHQITHRQVDFV